MGCLTCEQRRIEFMTEVEKLLNIEDKLKTLYKLFNMGFNHTCEICHTRSSVPSVERIKEMDESNPTSIDYSPLNRIYVCYDCIDSDELDEMKKERLKSIPELQESESIDLEDILVLQKLIIQLRRNV